MRTRYAAELRKKEYRRIDSAPCRQGARVLEPFRRADVEPEPRELEARELTARDRRVEHRLERPAARRELGEPLRIEDRQAGVREKRRRCADAPFGVEAEIAARVVRGVRHEDERRLVRALDEHAKVEVRVHVRVHEQERLVPEQRQRVHDAAAGLERRLALFAVLDRYTEAAAVADALANLAA